MRSPLFFLLLLLLLIPSASECQWVNDPVNNLMICDTTGEQNLPKIASTSDGGNYISWFDSRSGSYCVYLQRLDPLGNKMWAPNGLLISSNAQSSSLVDYDLICDAQNNAIVVFTDERNSGNLNAFAYKISPAGAFLWGPNGIDLNPTADFQANPKVVQTTDGGYVVAWIVTGSPYKTALQKLSSDGTKLWGSTPILLYGSGNQGFNHPALVPSDNNSVILVHTFVTGNFPAQTVKLRAQKLNSSGAKMWGVDGVNIQNIGTIAAFSVPKVYPDGFNGAIVAWHDDRDANSLQSAFVQRVLNDSTKVYPENGVELSLMSGEHKFSPVAAINPTTQDIYAFWLETDSFQNMHGISGQRVSSAGSRLWTDNAKVFLPLSGTSSVANFSAHYGTGKAILLFLLSGSSGVNSALQAFAVNAAGDYLWTGNYITMSNATLEKLHMVSSMDVNKNVKSAWEDRRNDRGVYAQDINPNGQLGNPVIPVELISFTASSAGNDVMLAWSTASEKNNYGFEIERRTENSAWTNLGFIPGAGTSSLLNSYAFTDKSPAPGKYTYLLKQIDFNGSYMYISETEAQIFNPGKYELSQNYPNPFNPVTTISFSIPDAAQVEISIYNSIGQKISTILNSRVESGNNSITFDASSLGSGIYFYTITSGNFRDTRKMILMK